MANRVMIIAPAETFIIRGLEAKLKGINVDAKFSTPKLKEMEVLFEVSDLLILFTDENQGDITESLVYLKDHCIETGKQIIIFGEQSEYEAAEKILTKEPVFCFQKRPLVMEKLLDDVENYFSDATQHARRKSILIVDDDVTYMSMINDWIKDSYRVSMMNSGVNAITWLATNHADLILLDYEMPITSGPQVLEMIRAQTATADIPVMFLTGKGDKESVMKVMSLKPVGYLLKTIKREELRENIAKFFMMQKNK